MGSFEPGAPLSAGHHHSPTLQRGRDEARRPDASSPQAGRLGVGAPAARLALFFSRAPIGVDREALARLLHPLSTGPTVGPSAVAPPAGKKENSGSSWLPAPAAFASRLHVGVYGFRRAALSRFVSLPLSELESLESLEQMRALQAGFEIVVGEVSHTCRGVDTLDDLRAARQHLGGSAAGEGG